MKTACLFIILIFVFVAAFTIYLIYKSHLIEGFNKSDPVRGYAQETDTYLHPHILNNVIDQETIDKIVEYAKPKLVDSMTVGGKQSTIRNSQQTWLPKTLPFVAPIYEKVSKIYNIPIENAEDLQVVRYLPGQYYNEHHDSCCDESDKCRDFEKIGGQRKLTVLMYLNDKFTDGETFFKNLNLKLKAEPGSAVVFYPLATDNNKCHPHALHAGLPVTSGEKWIANIWFRESRFK